MSKRLPPSYSSRMLATKTNNDYLPSLIDLLHLARWSTALSRTKKNHQMMNTIWISTHRWQSWSKLVANETRQAPNKSALVAPWSRSNKEKAIDRGQAKALHYSVLTHREGSTQRARTKSQVGTTRPLSTPSHWPRTLRKRREAPFSTHRTSCR